MLVLFYYRGSKSQWGCLSSQNLGDWMSSVADERWESILEKKKHIGGKCKRKNGCNWKHEWKLHLETECDKQVEVIKINKSG